MTIQATINKSPSLDMKAQVSFGRKALQELRILVKSRPNPVIINGKRYLEFCDWQILGTFFGITASVQSTEEIWLESLPKKYDETISPITWKQVGGFKARAVALKDGQEISAAEAECMFEEPNWKNKPRFTLRSMAETRAMAKCLRNVLQWVVKLPDEKGVPMADDIADEAAEEIDKKQLL
jgi:hypothetical protein